MAKIVNVREDPDGFGGRIAGCVSPHGSLVSPLSFRVNPLYYYTHFKSIPAGNWDDERGSSNTKLVFSHTRQGDTGSNVATEGGPRPL